MNQTVTSEFLDLLQRGMPEHLTRSEAWTDLVRALADAPAVSRERCSAIICEWMFDLVLPTLQPLAYFAGFGPKWKVMWTLRSENSARAAAKSASEDEHAGVWKHLNFPAASSYASAAAGLAASIVASGDFEFAGNLAGLVAKANDYVGQKDFWAEVNPADLLKKLISASQAELA